MRRKAERRGIVGPLGVAHPCWLLLLALGCSGCEWGLDSPVSPPVVKDFPVTKAEVPHPVVPRDPGLVYDVFTGQPIPGARPLHVSDGPVLPQTPAPTFAGLMDLLTNGVSHPMAPVVWRVGGLTHYASLHQAVAAGDLYAVVDRVLGGEGIADQDEGGSTPLLVAAASNQPHIADFLLDRGAAVDARDALGRSVLHLTARASHLYTLENFLRRGAPLEGRDGTGRTPLHVAAEEGEVFAVHRLLKAGADWYSLQDPNVLSIPHSLAAARKQWDVTAYFRSRGQYYPLHVMVGQGDVRGVAEALDIAPEAVNLTDALQTTPLIVAARSGHREVIQLLLSRGADIHARNFEGENALAAALRTGNLDGARDLIGAGANVNELFSGGFVSTLIGRAIREKAVDGVALLLEHGADPNLKDAAGRTPLHVAVDAGSAEICALLLARGASAVSGDRPGWSPAGRAVQQGNLELLQVLAADPALAAARCPGGRTLLHEAAALGHGAMAGWLLELGIPVGAVDYERNTALHRAAAAGHSDVAALLVARGGLLEAVDLSFRTPLLAAVAGGHRQTAEQLIALGARVETTDVCGRNAVFIALEHGHPGLALYLVGAGVPVMARNIDGRTAMFPAVRLGDRAVMEALAMGGLSLAETDPRGWSTLHEAAAHGGPASLEYLIERGADPAAVDRSGRTALHLACERGNLDLVSRLLLAGASAATRDAGERTALHYGAVHGDVVRFLAVRGVEVNGLDRDGRTALSEAASAGSVEGVRALLSAGACLSSGSETPLALATASLARCAPSERATLEGTLSLLDASIREACRRAAESGDLAALGQLLDSYPEYRDAPTFGYAPIHWAAARGRTAVLALLGERGADLALPTGTSSRDTARDLALAGGHTETAAWLNDGGVSPEVAPPSDGT